MLKQAARRQGSARGQNFWIIASRYNAKYVDSMLSAATAELEAAGAAGVHVVRVPGAFEIPVAAAAAAHSGRADAVICLGVILRGATTHAEHIGRTVTDLLGGLAVATRVPVIHEVLLLENEAQAVERCLDAKRNRGIEAARTAVSMGRVMRELRPAAPAE